MAVRRRPMRLLVTTISVSATPTPAVGRGRATFEEFVCFRPTPTEVKLGTGDVVTTPSDNVNVVCTGQPF